MMLTTNTAIAEVALPQFDARALLRRAALPALVAIAAAALVLLAGGRVHAFLDALRRGLSVDPAWAGAGAFFELASLAGYVGLLALVAGRQTPRIGARESAQITLAGAAATRLLPTAGAGGVALALWSLRRAGLAPRDATRTLLAFMALLYGVFLAAIVLSGGALALGLVRASGPSALAAVPALVALLAIAASLTVACRPGTVAGDSRLASGVRLLGDAVREAQQLIHRCDARLFGAVAYWAFDAAVLWTMLRAFGATPALPVVALAYFVGQVANTLPVPGSVSGGMTGVLIAFAVPAAAALPAVLAYRAIAIWLPTPIAIASVAGLRATIARWGREEGSDAASEPPGPLAAGGLAHLAAR
jgi:putative heme transporter